MTHAKPLSCLILATALLTACQTTRDPALTGKPVADAGAVVSGTWRGHFINTQGSRYAATFTLSGENGKVTGTAHIPSSSFETRPTLSGTYAGSNVDFKTSSGFVYDTTMTTDGKGRYALSGDVSGPNTGSVEVFRN